MLKPIFNERTALDIKARIVKWLHNHFLDESNWIELHGRYAYPCVHDIGSSGVFDDTADSIVVRVLKDMHNLGTLSLLRSSPDLGMAGSVVILNHRLRLPLPEWVIFDEKTGGYIRTTTPDERLFSDTGVNGGVL